LLISISEILYTTVFITDNSDKENVSVADSQQKSKVQSNNIDDLVEYSFKETQKLAIQKLLQENPCWRIAISKDCTNPNLEDFQKSFPGYTPYYVEEDITGDNKKDFAITLINGKDFGVVWFQADVDSSYKPPQWLFNNANLEECGLSINKKNRWLMICYFYTDNCSCYEWDSKSKKLVEKIFPDEK
jgi:hypothetical protein